MSKSTRPRRRWRKALVGLGALLVVLTLLVAAAPTLVNLGLGRGVVVSALEGRVNGTVSFDRLGLGWFGPQTVSGLTVTGVDGKTAAVLDLGVNAGLLGLLAGRVEELEVDVSGALSGELRRDGSTSFQDLFARPRPELDGPGRPAMRAGDRAPLAGVPLTTVRIDGVSVELREAGTDVAIVLGGLAGALEYEPGGRVRLELAGTTAGGSAPGSLTIAANGQNVFDDHGALSLDGAGVEFNVALANVPVLLAERFTELRTFHFSASSDDLADQLVIRVETDAVIAGAGTGRLEADLTLERPVQPDGTLALGLDRITGRVTGRGVPTALLQTAFAGTPIVVTRDIGPLIEEVEARFSSGGARSIYFAAKAGAMEVELAGVVDPQTGSIEGELFRVSAEVSPDLVAEVTDLHIDQPARVEIDVGSFSIPPQGEDPGAQLAGVAATGTLTLTTPLAIAGESGGSSLATVEGLDARFETEALGKGFNFSGTATVDGAEASFDISVSGYLAEDGSFDRAGMVPAGTASLRDVTAATIARFAPGQAELIETALSDGINITLVTSLVEGELRAALTVDGVGHHVELVVARRGDVVHVADGRGTLAVSPRLAKRLQEEAGQPIALLETAQVSFELDPFDLPAGGGFPTAPVTARVDVSDVALDQVPGLAEPIGVRDLSATITADGGEVPSISIEGRLRLQRVTQSGALAELSFGAAAVKEEDAFAIPRIDLDVSKIAVRRVDQVLGNRPGGLLTWVGDTGNANLTFRADAGAHEATIKAEFPRIRGEFAAAAEGGVISVTAGEATVSVSREAIQQRLAPPGAPTPARPAAGRPPPAGVTVAADVPLALQVRSLRVPRALLAGEPFDPAAVDVNLLLSGGPLVLDDPQQGRSSIDDLRITLSSSDLNAGLKLSLAARVSASAGGPGELAVQGRLTGLVTDGVLTPDTAELAMNATARDVHSAVVDAVAGWQGLLVAAVGPRMDLTATARRFSRTTGNVQARVETTNGWLDVPRATGRENALRIHGADQLKAELEITPPLRERLLRRIHPVLGDIRTTEQPVRVTMGGVIVPFDGDVSRLQADLDITIGPVEFDSGSVTLALLMLVNASNARTIPGEIEPIKARIRKGIVTYERFAVRIDEYTLVYTGEIDLNRRTVNLRTEIPLEGLAHTFRELEGYADKIVVPLVTRGRLGELTKEDTQIDPEFDVVEAAVEAGFRGLLDDVSEDLGIPVGDIFDDIFKKKKKKKKR